METNDIILIILGVLGWVWAIVQFFINRMNESKDKLIDRKYEAYSGYMKKADEIMNNIRKDPNMVLNIFTDFLKEIPLKNPDEVDATLIKFNERLCDSVKNATEPLMILRQELNNLLIVCSDELKFKINDLTLLTMDYNNEVQKCLSSISPKDSNSMIQGFQTLGQNEKWLRFQTLNDEVLELMRTEIGSNKKSLKNSRKSS